MSISFVVGLAIGIFLGSIAVVIVMKVRERRELSRYLRGRGGGIGLY